MQEYISEAVVLNKEPQREFDARYSFFTKRFGKVVGKATSVRKITSKLAGHLEPGSVVWARFVKKNGNGDMLQIADVLKRAKLTAPSTDLRLLDSILHDGEADAALWNELSGDQFSWGNILRLLGWDPAHAVCESCGKGAEVFYISRQEFFCVSCASKFGQDKLILVANGRV